MTGAPVPEGADAVVMKEDVSVTAGHVVFRSAPRPGENVRRQGRDVAIGTLAVSRRTLIRPPEVAMLASLGMASVPVFARPRVAVFTTGDELVTPGRPLLPGQFYNSNGPMLAALAIQSGLDVVETGHLPDEPEATRSLFAATAPLCDAIITSGGVSVGEHDYVRPALEATGEIIFWRVSMKPGKPIVFGRIQNCLFFGLPGNPVSSMVSFELFARPALLKAAGRQHIHRARVRARLLSPIDHRPGREEYARVYTTRCAEEFVSRPYAGQGSHMISSLVAANSLAIVPAEAGSLAEGARVDVLMTDWPEE